MIVGENRSKLNPTAHFPSVYTAGNTFGENAMKKHKADTILLIKKLLNNQSM
jgi:hypothetical protein